MSQSAAHSSAHVSYSTFLPEARRNLRLLRALYGARSGPYRRLLRVYREAADRLGCRRDLERVAHVLRPRSGRRPSRLRHRGAMR